MIRVAAARYWRVVALAALFAASQAADFLTYHPTRELNPLIVSLPTEFALAVKWFLVVYVCSVSVLLARTGRFRRVAPFLFGLGAVVGLAGAATNLVHA